MNIEQVLEKGYVDSYDKDIYCQVKTNWDKVAKPLDSLGHFEHYISKMYACLGTIKVDKINSAIAIMCADNGIVEEGISQSPKEVTAICASNIAKKKSAVGIMALENDIEIFAIDVGIEGDVKETINRKIARGTKNFLKEPAMTKEEMYMAMQVGMDVIKECKKKGINLVGTGEMGIGNTTTTSAVAAALLHLPAKTVTGRGAGLSDEGLARKIQVIDEAIEKYNLYNQTPIEILRTVGGLDIAALIGMFIGAAVYHMPIVLDGIISMVAALLAQSLVKGASSYMIPSHISKEPTAITIAKILKLEPIINANMALGEGTGAVLMISLMKTVNQVYMTSSSFEDYKIEQYERF